MGENSTFEKIMGGLIGAGLAILSDMVLNRRCEYDKVHYLKYRQKKSRFHNKRNFSNRKYKKK